MALRDGWMATGELLAILRLSIGSVPTAVKGELAVGSGEQEAGSRKRGAGSGEQEAGSRKRRAGSGELGVVE
jgi:hypothetical protein